MARMDWAGTVKVLKGLLPDSEHPAASQPTPYGLNRWVMLAIYVLHVVVTACDYLGWGPLSAMLVRSRAFLWLCSEEEKAAHDASDGFGCMAQHVTVQQLFSCCYAAHFITNGIAGFLLDFAGPRVTALLGATLSLSSWVLLGACSESFRALFPAFIMMGAASGMTYLPMLTIVNLFPGSFGFSVCVMGAGAALSLIIPSLLNYFHKAGASLMLVCWAYAVCGPLVGIIVVSLFVPLNGFIDVDLFVLVRSINSPHSSVITPAETQQSGISSPEALRANSLKCSSSDQAAVEAADIALSTVTDDDYFQPFQKEACAFLYFGICLHFLICSFSIIYYQQAAPIFLVEGAFEALEVASPFSILLCMVLGRIIDYVPIVYVMMFVNGAGILSYLLASFKTLLTGFLSVSFFSLYISISTSQVFIYTKTVFTSVHFGKLAGLVCMVGGLVSLLIEMVFRRLTIRHHGGDCLPGLWIMFGVLLSSYLLLFPLAHAANRKQAELNRQKVLGKQYSLRPPVVA